MSPGDGPEPDIYLIGSGINLDDHLTPEAVRKLGRCHTAYHLTAFHERLAGLCAEVVDLRDVYFSSEDGSSYRRIADMILDHARRQAGVAFVTYGHPMVLVDSCQMILAAARAEGLRVDVVSGVSSIDVLLQWLQLDVGLAGLQIYEVNQMVLHGRPPNPQAACLVMQVGAFGSLRLAHTGAQGPERYAGLRDFLLRAYAGEHPVMLMTFPFRSDMEPIAIRTTIAGLPDAADAIHTGMTLYIPPGKPSDVDPVFLSRLEASLDR